MASPFEQHFNTNYVPTSQELDTLKVLIEEEEPVIDAIDAEIATLMKKRATHTQRVGRHRALASPVRRLPYDIVLAIFFEFLTLAEPWPSPHPALVASHVCHRWRELALGAPLLWTKIEILLPWAAMEEEYRDSLSQTERPHETMEDYFFRLISLSRPNIEGVEERVRGFIQRSGSCPLDLLFTAEDIAHMHASPRLPSAWTAMLDPLCQTMTEATGRWKNVIFDLKVTPGLPTSLRFLQILSASSGSRVETATLRLRTHSHELSISEAQWEEILSAGRIDLRSAKLRALSMKMTFPDICRIVTSWGGLTSLVINTSPHALSILPGQAYAVLRLTRNLIRCTICLSFPPSHQTHQTPHLAPLTLPTLKSLTLGGFVPPCAFAEALNLPSLECLHTVEASGPTEGGSASSVLLWIRRHGTQLKEVSLAPSSVPKSALSDALKHLPNVESLELSWNRCSNLTGDPSRVFDELELFRALALGSVGGLCPKLRALVCWHPDGLLREAPRAIVDLIAERRSVTRASSIAWLDKISIMFTVPQGRSILEELKRRGVNTGGVSIGIGYRKYSL